MKYHWDLWHREMDSYSLSLTEEQYEKLELYYEFLIQKNQVMNLTAITEWEQVVIKHFADSAMAVRIPAIRSILERENAAVLDMGTGAGFPGIPLKIIFPQITITLADSLRKRVSFLEEVCSLLSLKQAYPIHGRAEELGRNPSHREQYDLCLSRAVANLSTLSEYCLPFVRVGGSFLSYKGSSGREEMLDAGEAITALGGRVACCDTYDIGDGMGRVLLQIEKIRQTPGRYPRKAGIPGKEPIGLKS